MDLINSCQAVSPIHSMNQDSCSKLVVKANTHDLSMTELFSTPPENVEVSVDVSCEDESTISNEGVVNVTSCSFDEE